METKAVSSLNMNISRIGLGTWAIGGFMWGGTDEMESLNTIRTALDKGINLIDTAPVYGFGKSENIVGKAITSAGARDKVHISTKAGLEWDDGGVQRNSTQVRIMKEVDESLKRLKTDYIDIYFIHWPDPAVPFEETAEAVNQIYKQGKIRAVGVSNYSPKQMDAFRNVAPVQVCQPPYNIFERGIEDDVKPYCENNGIALMTYGVLCRGLLTGKITKNSEFTGDDLRKLDPKFKPPLLENYMKTVDLLDNFARDNFGKSVIHLAARWALDKGMDIALWGARRPDQLDALDDVMGWKMDKDALSEIENIVKNNIPNEVNDPDFMAPPARI
ncbi:MAG: general stress protein [candidate division Zixibacteria bacterium]|nr:general stress protein [candidate division Zixibacteria bacterium]